MLTIIIAVVTLAMLLLVLGAIVRFSIMSSWRTRNARDRLRHPDAAGVERVCGFPPPADLVQTYREGDLTERGYGATTPAKNSLHSAGWAIDINYRSRSAADRKLVLQAADAAGLGWGGNFSKPDTVHFFVDPTGGNKNLRKKLIDQAQVEYEAGGGCGCE